MTPLPRPSVSPLYSFCSTPSHRATFADDLRSIWRWWRPRPAPLRERQLEEAVIAKLVAELEDEKEPPAETSLDKPKLQPKRPRRFIDNRPIP